jgi:hypothetical protein
MVTLVAARAEKTKEKPPSFGEYYPSFKDVCVAIAEDGMSVDFYQLLSSLIDTPTSECLACKNFFRGFASSCRPKISSVPVKQKAHGDEVHAEHVEEEGAESPTPVVIKKPTLPALDVLDAPRRMKEFFASRLLKLLTSQAQSRLFSLASKPFFLVADRILGARFLSDITEFFTLFRTMEDGFVKRANEVEAVLKQLDTSFMVVTTLESAPLHEAEFLIDALRKRGFSLNSVIANRVTPQELVSQAQAALNKLEASIQDPSFVQAVVKATEAVEPTAGQISRVVSTIARKSAEAVRKGEAEQSTLDALRKRSAGSQAELCICAISGAEIARATALVALGESVRPA